MVEHCEILKLLGDSTRLRMLQLLFKEELSVAELQKILNMGQSRISTHLSLLRQAELVNVRKEGKKVFYSYREQPDRAVEGLMQNVFAVTQSQAQVRADFKHLVHILDKRRKVSEEYFNSIAERLGKNYCPGRSWESIGHMLLQLTPNLVFADLGSGEGVIAHLLAKKAKHVYCVDSSPKMVQVGSDIAKKHELVNLTYQLGDIESVPLSDNSIDVAILSQALHHASRPQGAINEAYRILKPGGRLLVLDLKEHKFLKAKELYADRWLGFSENTLYQYLKAAGFQQIDVYSASKETREPFFETLLAAGTKGS
ncbi:MAG: transcriptional regulator [Verrucomicrobia bacterium CG_4_10_14_3_um_filter_43_23]|nr:MAG: transcriptional regulator [Verrucomicrobia bacterium CG22_combo_CG10-13_8_21_14_all_43_17]PIX57769.1 MAG: transcriptional regulator [Verrucomicrobia bacterium CG_4_10_14_3_um_filter_43_23]PIY61065.1 MAG: transcriptional regulator [Verrucomicrobia bacterium CG_4_10_14_0_8_um_filter_43_34]PJA44237.1 MAG: transcriptional regulator [Verrucomicrobia bacterium CG_4_9_14_3_um_filter_43_20]